MPRWQIGLFWRTDGEPLWTDDDAAGRPVGRRARHHSTGARRRPQLLGAIADGLGLPAAQVRPAYEDPLSRLAAAVRQPDGQPVPAEDDLESDSPMPGPR